MVMSTWIYYCKLCNRGKINELFGKEHLDLIRSAVIESGSLDMKANNMLIIILLDIAYYCELFFPLVALLIISSGMTPSTQNT